MIRTIVASALIFAGIAAVWADTPKAGILENVTRLTQMKGRKLENPRFSPDGKKIAFTNFGFDGLYVMNIDGTDARCISDASGVGHEYRWSADSREILVRDTRWLKSDDGMLRRAHAALSVNVATGETQKLTADHEYMQPAVWRYAANGAASVVCDVETASVAATLSFGSNEAMKEAVAKPAFQTDFIHDTEHLWTVDALGNKALIHTGCALVPVLSPDGMRVAFVTEYDDIVVMNIDGSNAEPVAKGFHPAWASDSQLVYESTVDDGHTFTSGELMMVNIADKTTVALTNTPVRIEMNAAMSPDGTTIVFTDFNDGQVYTAKIR